MLEIGIDIVNLADMTETLKRSGDIFLKRVYSPAEIKQGKGCENPMAFFASAFAAKEAVFKALKLTWQPGIDLRHIEVSRGPLGEPLITLSGRIGELAAAKGEHEMAISLSYETTIAIAMVVFLFRKQEADFR
ncbi:MAG: holo-[acyl-carrier-protein] synthase [Chloroflexi bacterium HGW-Chloroflexi-10]|nr:MAG: holo-[acyl-carrier-protein] synthase [Chloroflexi bacterium HGW-Chloroflexi-10]